MDVNKPVVQGELRLILSRLFPQVEDWETVFAPVPAPPEIPVRFPPVVVTGEKPLTAEEISQMRGWIQSSESGDWKSWEVDAMHSLIGKGGK